MQRLVVDALVEVLNEDVALTSLPQRGISLAPHDSASSTFNEGVVEMLESTLAVGGIEVVDIGVSERSSRHSVSTDPDAEWRL